MQTSSCPGPWRGLFPFPLPLTCDQIHILVGIVAGYFRSIFLSLAFCLYQITEEYFTGVPENWAYDIGVFMMGYTVGKVLSVFSSGGAAADVQPFE